MDARIALTTTGTREEAEKIAHSLVQNGLVACVSLVPSVHSIYRWQDRVEESEETLLILKTTVEHLPRLETALHTLHSYQTPEFLVIPVEGGSAAYLDWLRKSVP